MTFNTLKIVGKNGNDRSGVKLALNPKPTIGLPVW